MKLPQVIHYCWFGGAALPPLAQKCIASWKKYCPDCKIIEWNESNYDIASKPLYVRQAYEEKKWAFVSDYARFDILYRYGGLYFDTDVEIIRPIADIIAKGPFMACEKGRAEYHAMVAPGLGMAANAGDAFLGEILNSYRDENFVFSENDNKTVTIVKRTTELLRKYGLKDVEQIQTVGGFWIYPPDYFCPLNYRTNRMKKTKNTRAIHWYDGSWFTERQRTEIAQMVKRERIDRRRAYIRKLLGQTVYDRLKKIKNLMKIK